MARTRLCIARIAEGVREKRANRVDILFIQRPCAICLKRIAAASAVGLCLQVQTGLAGLVGGEGILRHLRSQRRRRRPGLLRITAVHDEAAARRQLRFLRAALPIVAVAVGGDHAAVVVRGAEGTALLALRADKADVGEVIAAVRAVLLLFPVEHADLADIRRHRPVAVVDEYAARVLHTGGIGVAVLRIFPPIPRFRGRAEARQPERLQFRRGHGLRAARGLRAVQPVLLPEAVGTAVEVIAVLHAAGGGKAVRLGARRGHGRRAVGSADNAAVVRGKAAELHLAAADGRDTDRRDAVAALDAPVVLSGEAARAELREHVLGIDRGAAHAALLHIALIVADEAADIDCAAAVGQRLGAVARCRAAAHRAGIVADERADVGAPALDAAVKADDRILPAGNEHDVAQLARVAAEQARIDLARSLRAAAPETVPGDRRADDLVPLTVVGVDERLGRAVADGELGEVHRGLGAVSAIVLPVVADIVDAALLHKNAALIEPLPVFVVVKAQRVELARRADGNARRALHRAVLAGRRHRAGKVRRVEIRRAVDPDLLIEAVRIDIFRIHRPGRQRQEVIAPPVVGDLHRGIRGKHFCLLYRDARCRPGPIGDRDRRGRLAVVNHAVAVAQHRFVVPQGRHVAAEEAIACRRAVLIMLVVRQRAGLKLRLPVAVVRDPLQLRVRVVGQAHALHEVVGVGASAARHGGKCGAKSLRRGGAAGAAPFSVADTGRFGDMLCLRRPLFQIKGPRRRSLDLCIRLRRRVGQINVRIERNAHAVASRHSFDRSGGQARRDRCLLEARGVAARQTDRARPDAAAKQSAGPSVRLIAVEVAVGIAALCRHSAVRLSDQAARRRRTPKNRGGKAAVDGDLRVPAHIADQTAGHIADEPNIPLRFCAQTVARRVQIDAAAGNAHRTGQRAGKTADPSRAADLRAGERDVRQRAAGKALKQARVAVRIHRQMRDHRTVRRAVHGIAAPVFTQRRVNNGAELLLAVDRRPAARAGEVNVLLLHRAGDDRRQLGGLVQILQVAGAGDDRRIAAAQRMEQTICLFGHKSRALHQRVVAGDLNGDGQILPGRQHFQPFLLRKAAAAVAAQVVERHRHLVVPEALLDRGERLGIIFQLGARRLISFVVADGDEEMERTVIRRLAGDAHLQRLPVEDLRPRREHAGVIDRRRVAAIVADLRRFHALAAVAQHVEPGMHAQRLLAVKHRVDAAAVRVVLHEPMALAQLGVGLLPRQDVIRRGGGVVLFRVGHIPERKPADIGLVVLVLFRVERDIGKALHVAAALVFLLHTGGQKLRHAVLRGLE